MPHCNWSCSTWRKQNIFNMWCKWLANRSHTQLRPHLGDSTSSGIQVSSIKWSRKELPYTWKRIISNNMGTEKVEIWFVGFHNICLHWPQNLAQFWWPEGSLMEATLVAGVYVTIWVVHASYSGQRQHGCRCPIVVATWKHWCCLRLGTTCWLGVWGKRNYVTLNRWLCSAGH